MHQNLRVVLLVVYLFTLFSPVSASSQPLFTCVDVSEIPQAECAGLISLYNSTNGDNWIDNTNWLVTNTPSDWFGVTVTEGHVTWLSLSNNGLMGVIPTDISNFSNLGVLWLSSNQLEGGIPLEIGSISSLWYLNLASSNLSGSIPTELGNLTAMRQFYLYNNQLTGSIPTELGNLTSVYDFRLNSNLISGTIPPEIGGLTNLTKLYLGENSLTGEIPTQIGNLAKLTILDLSGNSLTGSIPAELGNLSELTHLYLLGNQLSGNIPPELGLLSKLEYLHMYGNQLAGAIPTELGNLTVLSELLLGWNFLDGNIPVELGNLSALGALHLQGNLLSGEIPATLGNLTNLFSLSVSGNQLTGTIPAELGNLINLGWLNLGQNQLSGDIPASMANLVNLVDPGDLRGDGLTLDYNQLTVPIGYPDPADALHTFIYQKDPDWHLNQAVTTLIDSSGGTITALDGNTEISVPTGAVGGETTFIYTPQPVPNYETGVFSFISSSFQLNAFDESSSPITVFDPPLQVTISYADDEIMGINEESLSLMYWDEDTQGWLDAVTTCPGGEYVRDMEQNTFSLPICHLSEFGVFSTPQSIVFLPLAVRP